MIPILLSAEYLLTLPNFIPRQEIPEDKFINLEDIKSEYLAVSHIWETKKHPDPLNKQFDLVKSYLKQNPRFEFVFYDYSSLPQRHKYYDLNVIDEKDKIRIKKQLDWDIYKGLVFDVNIDNHLVLKKMMSQLLDQMPSVFNGYKNGCVVLSLHFRSECLLRGWPYYEMTICNLSPKVSHIENNILPMIIKLDKLSKRPTLGYQDICDAIDYPLFQDGVIRNILMSLKEQFMQNFKHLMNRINTRVLNNDEIVRITNIFKDIMIQVRTAMIIQGWFDNPDFMTIYNDINNNGLRKGGVLGILQEDLIKKIEFKLNVDDLRNWFRRNARHQIVYDLCFCTFTNGSDSDKVKDLILHGKLEVKK
jgi:hypothetical protein